MEVHFTPDREAQLSQMATHNSKAAEQLVKDAALLLLENNSRFGAAVHCGIEAADRGDFVEEEEVDARIEQILQS